MDDDRFFAVVARQRACREFTDEPLDDHIVERLLEAACWAPSPENRQPWRFVVVRDPASRAAFGQLMREVWEMGGRDITRTRVPDTLFREVDRGLSGGTLAAAPVLIVVGADTTFVDRSQIATAVAPAVQNMLLAATAIGLGSCLTTIATVRADDVRDLVGFPPEVHPVAVVPVGHPLRPLGPPKREPASSKTSRERHGTPWS